MNEGVYMSNEEIRRAEIFLNVKEKKISKTDAALELDLSRRQISRLYKEYKKHGIKGLVSKQQDRPSNHQLSIFIKTRILELVT